MQALRQTKFAKIWKGRHKNAQLKIKALKY
jgi:hypothetical protein